MAQIKGTRPMVHVVIGKPTAAPFTADGLEKQVLLRYRGSKGDEKERLVTVHTVAGTVDPAGGLIPDHLAGYCHLRQMPRTFVWTRIASAADPQTGEMIAHLLGYLGIRANGDA